MDDDFKYNLKRSAKGSVTLAFSQILSTILLAIGMVVVARVLGSNKWGLLSIANSIVTLVQIFQDFGIKDTLTKYISENKHLDKTGNVKIIIESGLALSITSSILLTSLLILSADYIANTFYNAPELGYLIKLLSIALIGRALLFASYGVTEGYERMELRGGLRIFYTFLKGIASPFLVLLGYGAIGGVIGEAGPILLTGISGLILIYLLYRKEKRTDTDINHKQALILFLSFGGPIYLANLVTSVRPQILTFLLGIHAGEEITGNFTVVFWFSSLISFVYLPIRTTIFPLLSKLSDKRDLKFVYRNSIKYASLFIYPIVFTIIALSRQIIEALFSTDYQYAPTYLKLYMIVYLYTGIGSLSNIPLLNSQKLTRETLIIQLIQFSVTVLPSVIIIPKYGAIGALTLLVAGIGVSKIYAIKRIHTIFNFYPDFTSSIKLFLSGLSLSLIIWYTFSRTLYNPWIELILGGILSLLLYLVLVISLKVLTKQDYRRIKELAPIFGPFSPYFKNIIEKISKLSH
ncbi:oligosaccharide flippase family protein [Candidatus Bathyarchaeota archaeon]|nr:oligosaccharide flippase family protein [Candidatus Bathyarchaeota archaeon]